MYCDIFMYSDIVCDITRGVERMSTMINSEEIRDIDHLEEVLPIQCFYEIPWNIEIYEHVEKWLDTLGLAIPRKQCITELNERLPWDSDVCHETMSNRELNIKYLSTAMGLTNET